MAQHYIRAWRLLRGLSQRRLADRLDMSYANLSRIESGKTAYKQSTLEAIALALDCTAADLLQPPPDPDDLPLWTVVRGLPPEARRQALRILRALAEEEDAA